VALALRQRNEKRVEDESITHMGRKSKFYFQKSKGKGLGGRGSNDF